MRNLVDRIPQPGISFTVRKAMAWSLTLICMSMISAVKADHTEPGPDEQVESFYINAPDDLVALTHSGGKLFMHLIPADIIPLSEPALKNVMFLAAKVRNSAGEVIGYAAQHEILLNNNPAVGIDAATHWVVVVADRGVLYLSELEHANPDFANDVVQKVFQTGRAWEGEFRRVASAGPRPDGRGVITGGTMAFENARGSFVEIHTYTRFTPEGEVASKSELRVFFEKTAE